MASYIIQNMRLAKSIEEAYKSINELAKKENSTTAEDFIQKSILDQIELSLIKKGFRNSDFRIKREEQLQDDKRLDITISYGFVGSIVLELKLAHNPEAKASTEKAGEYIQKWHQYLDGSRSDYGIFLIFNIRDPNENFKTQMDELGKLYTGEKKIFVIGLNSKVT